MTSGIEVEIPHVAEKDRPHTVRMLTELFRRECRLPEAVAEAYERSPDAGELRVDSFGCSVGAEADSVLSHFNSSGFSGRVVMRGWDIQSPAIRAARAGYHFLPRFPYLEEELSRDLEFLDEQGFGVSSDPVPWGLNSYGEHGFYQVDANPVREGHDVSFVQVDPNGTTEFEKPSDLILANNVLYHLVPEAAEQAIRNLAAGLSEQGILSLGDAKTHLTLQLPMGPPNSVSDKPFDRWLDDVVAPLEAEFGLKPIMFGIADQPVAFARP